MPSTIYRGRESGKMSTGAIIALVIVCVVVLGGFGCFFLVKAGFNMVGEQAKGALAGNPVIQEHIGEIQEIDLDVMGMGEAQNEGGHDSNTFVFKVSGTKGKGKVTATLDEQLATVLAGSLKMADGTVHPLLGTPAPEEE